MSQFRAADLQAAEAATNTLLQQQSRQQAQERDALTKTHEREIGLAGSRLEAEESAHCDARAESARMREEMQLQITKIRAGADEAQNSALEELRNEYRAELLRRVSELESSLVG